MSKIKFTKRHYIHKGKFNEVEILKQLNHIDASRFSHNEKELIKVLRRALQELSETKINWKITAGLLQKIYNTWRPR